MPKDTFYNLKETKQASIKEAALEEFATYGYFNANIKRITERCNIATGSFYQYFDDINDLFMCVFTDVANLKMRYLKEELSKVKGEPFAVQLKAVYLGGILFATNEPVCYKVANCFTAILHTPVFDELMQYYTQDINNDSSWMNAMVNEAIAKGELKEGITMPLFFKLLTGVNLALIESMGLLERKEAFTAEALHQFADLAVSILLNGVQHKEGLI